MGIYNYINNWNMSKEKAQELKAEGNRHYSSKDYDQAILF